MLLGILASILLGVTFGTFTGLIPGIHINLIAIFLISLSSTIFLNVNPIHLIVFITSVAITHTFIDFIPSIFLGCPDTDTELSILPGHQLLKKGEGYEAVLLSIYASFCAILILLLIAYPATIIFPKIYNLTRNILPYILITISALLLIIEKRKILATIIFVLTGILGYITLNLETINQPLLPLLTGLFGSSMLITSIKNKTKIPKQKIERINFKKRKFIRPLLGSLVAAPVCSFLPGLGSGQAAIIGNSIIKNSKKDKRAFIFLLGATNTLVMGFSFITLYLISKTRTGTASAMQKIIGSLSTEILILILITTLLTGIISFFTTKKITTIISKKINNFSYTKISFGILTFLTIMIILISGIWGLIIFIISTLTGIYCISLKTRKTLMMGCLMIPTILFYIGI